MEENKIEEKTKNKYPILVLIIGAIFILASLAFVLVPMITNKKDNNTNNNENNGNNNEQKEEKKKTSFDVNKVFTLVLTPEKSELIRYNGTIEVLDIKLFNYNDAGYDFNDKVIYYHASDNKLHKYEIDTKKDTNLEVELGENFSMLAMADDYIYLLTTDNMGGRKRIYNIATKEIKEIDEYIHTNNVFVYTYKNKLVYDDLNKGISLYDPSNNSVEVISSEKKFIVLPNYSYGNRLVYGENDHGNLEYYIYDLDTKKATKTSETHLGKYNVNPNTVTDENGKVLMKLSDLHNRTFKVVAEDIMVIEEYKDNESCEYDDVCLPDEDDYKYYLLDTKALTLDKIYNGYLYK